MRRGQLSTTAEFSGPIRLEGRSYDHGDVQTLVQALYAEQVGRYGFADSPDARAVSDYVVPQGLLLVGYTPTSDPVGCGGYRTYDRDERLVEVRKMFVQPDHGGQGLGWRLLHHLEQHAVTESRAQVVSDRIWHLPHGDRVDGRPCRGGLQRQRTARGRPEHVRRATSLRDQRIQVFDLPLHGVGLGEAARAASPTGIVVNREVLGESRCQGSVLGSVVQSAAYQDDSRAASLPVVGDGGAIV
ncbi:GNAT family N-acetyltransferase [Kribbella albertanoniae]|uniref:GNAT family N-acetyltransferase n=1 Tax=Kribbella albertanoniae TaxID=1266829 RepID=A0A4R4QCR2_9ACTN|nr:GNAT family N-acetyltransferase [Kribbella albertanoniae]